MRCHSFKSSALLLLLALTGCAGSLQVGSKSEARTPRTVVLFLVDGLGAKLLQNSLSAGKMPNTRKFFLQGKAGFAQGQAAFPSLTYPNLTSVLTTRPVGEHAVNGNRIVVRGKTTNFESPFHHGDLERAVDPLSVFTRLAAEGRTSASFSYVLGQNATDHMTVGLHEGLEYQSHDYQALDEHLIESLENYLADKGAPAHWPSFIYVHLVGVDGTAHLYGAGSPQTKRYLAWLDQRLGKIYQILGKAEQRKQVTTMLTADHGFVDTSRFVNLEKFIHHTDKTITIANESRFLGLYLSPKTNRQDFELMLDHIRSVPGVELTVVRKEDRLEFSTAAQTLAFSYGAAPCANANYSLAPAQGGLVPASSSFRCPEELDSSIQPYPLLVSGLSRYMNAPNRPDAVIIAKPDTSFTKQFKGNHGGPTADEMLVPVLLRNAELQGGTIPHTSDLLKTLDTL